MRTLAASPDQESYQLSAGADSIAVNYGGGASAIRRNFWGAPSIIQVRWTLSSWGYTYLAAFYRLTDNGALPFLVDLVVDESEPVTCRAKFVPGTFGLYAKTGDTYIAQAQLEAQPPTYDRDGDQAIIDAFVPKY